MQKVLFVLDTFRSGGIETMVLSFQKELLERGTQVDYLVCSETEKTEQLLQAISLGAGFHCIAMPGASRLRNLLPVSRRMEKEMRENGPYRAVHVHDPYLLGPAIRAAACVGIPVRVVHMHIAPAGRITWKERLHRRITWYGGLRRMTHAVACSRESARFLGGVTGSRKEIAVLPNGIDPACCRDSRKMSREAARELFSLRDRSPVLLQIGRMDSNKNQLFTLRVFQEVRRKYGRAHLVFVGDGSLRQCVEQETDKLGLRESVTFTGACFAIYPLLRACDVLLLPSLHEGFGLVALEAQAMGIPVLASRGVSSDADMALGLFERLELEAGPVLWSEHLECLLGQRVEAWDTIDHAIRENGHDIAHSAGLLAELYRTGQWKGGCQAACQDAREPDRCKEKKGEVLQNEESLDYGNNGPGRLISDRTASFEGIRGSWHHPEG